MHNDLGIDQGLALLGCLVEMRRRRHFEASFDNFIEDWHLIAITGIGM